MADRGRPIRFGVFPTPLSDELDDVFAMVRIAEDEGLDCIGIQDHPYQRRYLDTWMLMAAILPRTERVTVFPDVANLPLRPPAVMAKAAASLDVMSGGRFELGLGAGGFLQGDAAQWVDELTDLVVTHGLDTFVFGPAADPVRQTHRFAPEVAPAVRERVARLRG